jgi:GDP-L-fucose synthase
VGSAIVRNLVGRGYQNLVLRTHAELDLTDWDATLAFFESERPDYVFLAAAKVGGILANHAYPADFILENLSIQNHVVQAAFLTGVQRLLFLGSSCIYPKLASQPLKESALLTGPLEPTNRAYALAKIAGIELCWSFNRQHGTQYLSAMPTNLYGPGDNYHPENSHVIPALLRKFHEAKEAGLPEVLVWGTGTPRREFLFSDDMADASIWLMNLPDDRYQTLLGSDEVATGDFDPPLVNIGMGEDVTIAELATLIGQVVGYEGQLVFDTSKPDGTPRKLMDISRLKGLGWSPKTALEEGLREAYADFLEHEHA